MKLKKRNIVIISIIILIILIEIINPIKLYNKYQLRSLNYSEDSINTILEYNLKDKVMNLKYQESLDKILSSKDFQIKNFDIYKDLVYFDVENYTKNVNLLIDKGYNANVINLIFERSDQESLKDFLTKDYIENISYYLEYDFAYLKNIDRYIAYRVKTNVSNELAILYVNIGLDKEFYTDVNEVSEFSIDMLVNKYNKVSENFVPEDLVDVPKEYTKDNQKLNKETLEAFMKMSDDCKKETGYRLLVRSGYRDYKTQESIFNSYLKTYGKNYAESYATHPGFSEHHTGLAIDIRAESKDVFVDSKESKWTYKNAYKYGFILRYPKASENITGINYESWHFRYVGIEIAKYLSENDMTYEEYYIRFLNK